MIATWGMTSSEKRAILTRIKGSTDYSSLKECDIIIECVRSRSRVNHIQERVEIFKKIEQIVSDECIIATNSNSIVITELSAELNNKARTISLHFLTNTNANIIEVVRGLHTSEETYDRVLKFIAMLGKEPVPCEESAGLISVRMFVARITSYNVCYTKLLRATPGGTPWRKPFPTVSRSWSPAPAPPPSVS